MKHSKYKDVQGRLYVLDVGSGNIRRLGTDFNGSWADYTWTTDGKVHGLGQLGTEIQAYSIDEARAKKLDGRSGTYEGLTAAEHSPRILFRHSAIDEPTELYLAEDAPILRPPKPSPG